LFVYCPIASVLSFSPPPPSRHHGPAGMGGGTLERWREEGGSRSWLHVVKRWREAEGIIRFLPAFIAESHSPVIIVILLCVTYPDYLPAVVSA
jgi:hypothetical protein